jgi:exopolysaccharide biosynthesis protein
VRDGVVAPDIREGIAPSFGEQRHPRTAVGITADGRLLWVTVDGRQAPYSDGMSLAELADLMARLGARDAVNLDGGGSTTMVVRGVVVNRPSDAAGERPVGNALVLVGCDRPAGEG